MRTITYDDTKYTLVPIEPTEEMIKAFNSLPYSWASVTFAMKYKAMLNAVVLTS